jgi:dihydropyrimidinase
MFGMYPRKGAIAVGSDADLVVFDPQGETTWSAKTHHMNVDYNPYEGRRCRGAVETVMSRGEVIVEKGSFTGKAGRGRYLPRAART